MLSFCPLPCHLALQLLQVTLSSLYRLDFILPTPPLSPIPGTRSSPLKPHFPYGLSFLGKRFSEEQLVGYAYASEQKTQVRKTKSSYVVPNFQLADVIATPLNLTKLTLNTNLNHNW